MKNNIPVRKMRFFSVWKAFKYATIIFHVIFTSSTVDTPARDLHSICGGRINIASLILYTTKAQNKHWLDKSLAYTQTSLVYSVNYCPIFVHSSMEATAGVSWLLTVTRYSCAKLNFQFFLVCCVTNLKWNKTKEF